MRLFQKMFVAAAALLSVHGLLPMTGTTSAFAAEKPVQKVSAVSYVPNNALFVAYADGSVYEKLPALKAFFKEIISISGDQEQIQRFEKACDVTFHMTGSCYMETPASFDVFSGRDGVQSMAFRGFLNFDDPQEADAYLKDNRESWNYYKSYIEKEDVQMPVSKMDVKDEKYEGKDAFVVSMEFDWGDKPLV